MIDDERAASQLEEQTDVATLPKDTLEDLDVTSGDGAEIKGGVPKSIDTN